MLLSFCITKKGKSHELNHVPCQDFSYCKRIVDKSKHEWIISAVADGVGSCSNSHYGSKTAAVCAVDFLADNLREELIIDDDLVLSVLHKAYQEALDSVEAKADELQMPVITFDTTLTVTVFSEDSMYFGQSGDGGIVVLYEDGSYEMITKRQKGEEASSVFPLRSTDCWVFGKANKRVASLALMTDGVLDAVVSNEALDNRVYFPFFRPVLAAKASEKDDEILLKEYMEKVLSTEEYRERVTDDISYAAALNTDITSKLKEIEFDAEEWEQKTIEFDKRNKQYLNRQAQLYVQEHSKNNSGMGISEKHVRKKDVDLSRQKQQDFVSKQKNESENVMKCFVKLIEGSAEMGIQVGRGVNKALQRMEMSPGAMERQEKLTTKSILRDNSDMKRDS